VRVLSTVASALAGLLLALAFPPSEFAILVVIAPAMLLLVVVREASFWARALYGLAFGMSFFGLLVSWAWIFGWYAWLALVLVEACFAMLFTIAAGPLRRLGAARLCIATSALWVLTMEVARARFPLGGFPWGLLGGPLVATPVGAWAAFGGGVLVSWIAAYTASALAASISAPRSLFVFLPVVAVVIGGLLLPAGTADGKPLRVAVVQGNVPLPVQPASPARSRRVLTNHVRLTQTLAPGSVDLVVWPEGIIDLPSMRPGSGRRAPDPIPELARTLGTWFIVGVVSRASGDGFYNSALSIDPSGRVAGVYDKNRPVPFGEYVPARRYLGFIGDLQYVPYDMVPGRRPTPLPVPGGIVGTPISYEVTFSRLVQRFGVQAVNALVVPTNTSSYGPNAATADQELQASRMRARELGVWVIQSAPSGISALIDPSGSVVARTDLYEARVLKGTLSLRVGRTPFGRIGEMPAIVLAGLFAGWGLWARTATFAMGRVLERRGGGRSLKRP
jgi:apolipoprotein N-acyltransferase